MCFITISRSDVTLYHTGTDGAQFDFVTVDVFEGHRFECRMPEVFMDDKMVVHKRACYVVYYEEPRPELR